MMVEVSTTHVCTTHPALVAINQLGSSIDGLDVLLKLPSKVMKLIQYLLSPDTIISPSAILYLLHFSAVRDDIQRVNM